MPTREGKPSGVSGSFGSPREPGIYPERPGTFWSRLSDLTREDPKKLIAKSKNAVAYSEMLDISPSEAYDNHDAISERIFGEELTTPELIGGLALFPIAAAVATSPVGVLLGVGAYQAIAEAESAAISLAKSEPYKIFQNKGLVDLLPEDTSDLVGEVVDTFDVIGKMLVGRGVFKQTPKLGTKLARKIIVENKLPREVYISGKDLKAELQTGNILPAEQMEMVKALELGGKGYREALQKGLHIKIPAEKVIMVVDKPWYAKVKKLFKIAPHEEVRVMGGKPTAIMPEEIPKPFEATLYRGIARGGPIDEGMYGKGKYYTPNIKVAEGYAEDYGLGKGKVISSNVRLDNPFIATYNEVHAAINKAIINSDEFLNGTFSKMSNVDKAEFSSTKFTESLKNEGRDGVVITDNQGNPIEVVDFEVRVMGEKPTAEFGAEPRKAAAPGEKAPPEPKPKAPVKEPVPKEKEVGTKFEEFEKTLTDKQKKGKKTADVKRIFDLIEERYPEIDKKMSRVIQASLKGRHGETQEGVITLSTIDAPTFGHEVGELLQPTPQFGRSRTITGEEARKRDALSDAVAYVLTEEAGLKTPRKKPIPEVLDKARELLTGEQPEIPSPTMTDIAEEAARGIESPKTRIRLVTGQVKISELVREDVALAASLRKASKEARHAMSLGKKEGYDKAKKHYLELREKAKRRIAQKKYVQKLVDNITKPLGNSIDFFYKEGIENLREGIDPHFRSEKTLRAKERMQKFFADNPDKLSEMPVKFMRELGKKPLNEYTISDLEQISEEIIKLRKLGKTKRTLVLQQREHAFEDAKDDIVLALSKKGKGGKGDVPLVKATRQKAGKLSTARALTLRPSRIFDKLDGGQRFAGPSHEFFYDNVNRGVDESYKGVDKRLAASKKTRKSFGIAMRDLAKTRKIGKTKFTVDEMLDIYAGWMNPRKKLALMYGNNISEEVYAEVVANLTAKEKKFADWLVSEYENNYSRVREAHIEYSNEDMGHEPFYTPIRRMDITLSSYKSELAQEMLIRHTLKKAYVGKQFTIERKDIPREYQKPLHLGLSSVWLDQVPKQERYISLGGIVKNLQKLSSDPDFRQAVRDNFGPEYLEAVEAYNNRVANPSIYKAFNSVEKLSQTLRKNMVVAYLSYNFVTMGKQLPSVMLYLPEAGPAHLIAAGLQFASNPFKIIKFVNDKDPQVKHRMIERELEELKYSGKILKKAGRFGMKGIRLFDKIAVTTGWLAVYNKNVGKLGEAEAIRLAQNATLRTQPAAHAKDLPSLYTTNELLNWMTQFTNQLNQIYNIASYDIPQDLKKGRLYKAFLSSLALATVSLVIWVMTNRRLPEDEEDVKDALWEEALSALPLIGKYVLAASKGWERPSPAMKAASAAGKFVGIAGRDEKARALIEAAAVTTGTPYTGTKRAIEAVKKKDPLELLGKEKPKKKGRKRY